MSGEEIEASSAFKLAGGEVHVRRVDRRGHLVLLSGRRMVAYIDMYLQFPMVMSAFSHVSYTGAPPQCMHR